MSSIPHQDQNPLTLQCAIITISDTRTTATDKSGQLIHSYLTEAGHKVKTYLIIPDEPREIQQQLTEITANQTDLIIINGGTGIAPRDTTYDALESLLEKTLPGFGEIFRYLSYNEIGSRAIASRAIAGVYQQTLIFSLPGSSNAVKLALEKLILPEIIHLVKQIQGL